jgi:hypothetical protein
MEGLEPSFCSAGTRPAIGCRYQKKAGGDLPDHRQPLNKQRSPYDTLPDGLIYPTVQQKIPP